MGSAGAQDLPWPHRPITTWVVPRVSLTTRVLVFDFPKKKVSLYYYSRENWHGMTWAKAQ